MLHAIHAERRAIICCRHMNITPFDIFFSSFMHSPLPLFKSAFADSCFSLFYFHFSCRYWLLSYATACRRYAIMLLSR